MSAPRETFGELGTMLRSRDVSASHPTTTSVSSDDWQLLLTARPNTLLEGPYEETDAFVGEVMEWLGGPHATWTGAPNHDRPATLVVRSVSALDRDQQLALLAWLDAPGDRIQVIST